MKKTDTSFGKQFVRALKEGIIDLKKGKKFRTTEVELDEKTGKIKRGPTHYEKINKK